MKNRILFILIAIICSINIAEASENLAPITKVLVFADRAEVKRTAKAVCKNDTTVVVFKGLPSSLDSRTLRAEATNKAEAIGITSMQMPLNEQKDEYYKNLQIRLRKVLLLIKELKDQMEIHNRYLTTLNDYANYYHPLITEDMRNRKPGILKWEKTLDKVTEKRIETAKKKAAVEFKLRKLNKERDKIKNKISKLNPHKKTGTLNAEVSVKCYGETKPEVFLYYVVPGATWKPEFDFRFSPFKNNKVGKGNLEITVGAIVQQTTGEDWSNIELELSTARPKAGSEAPYPAAMYVNGYKHKKDKVLVQAKENRQQLKAGGKSNHQASQDTQIEDKGHSFTLKLPHKVTVKADGHPYWMPVDIVKGQGESSFVTVPKLKPFVYQSVKLNNPASYPLPEGKLHTFRKNSYVGDNRLKYKAPGEPFEVSLGIDEEIKVERKEIKEKNKEAGFLSSTKHMERAYRIIVTNSSKKSQTIYVRENIPVSKTKDIKVELVKKKTTKNYSLDKHRGMLEWAVKLDPGQKKSIDLSFIIHLPEDWKVR